MKNSVFPSANSGFFPATDLALPAVAMLLLAPFTPLRAEPGNDQRAPEVPAALVVRDGSKVSFHAYAAGVQIYVWTVNATNPALSAWVFKAPEAVLFADADGHGVAGIHYAGPTWESDSGSKVVGARIDGKTVDPTAIPWLLLRAVSATGPGVFDRTTYIQRVNTVGGLPPATPGTSAGEEARVLYTAEYFFYRQQN